MTLSEPPPRTTIRSLAAALLALLCGLTLLGPAAPPGLAAGTTSDTPVTTRTAARATLSLEVATTNINTYRAKSGQRAQLRRVLALTPDAVLVQEVGDLDLARETAARIPGIQDYVVVQDYSASSKEYQRASAVLFRRDRFGDSAVKSGFALGYQNVAGVTRPPARYLPWARVRDLATGQRINLVSVHLPTGADASYRRAQARMLDNYRALIERLRGKAGLPVVVGGDYNNELYRPPAGQRSVAVTRAAGLKFGWADATAAQRQDCPTTFKGGGTRRIDGVAYPRTGATFVSQRCLGLKNQDDHRSVVVELTLSTPTPTPTPAVSAQRAAAPDLTNAVTTPFADPGFLVDRSSGTATYYLYATGGDFRSRTATSPRGPFRATGRVMAPRDPATSWEKEKGHRWAPHVFRSGGRYVLYYTGTPKGGTDQGGKRFHDCIGVATAPTPVPVDGQPSTRFTPATRPLICSGKNQTLIDPAYYRAGDRHYVLYKRRTYSPSTYDIMALEVTAGGTARKAGAKPFLVLRSPDGRIIEAPSLVRRKGTLWLFTSRRDYASCDYRTEVFSASGLKGPWRSRGVMNLRPRISASKFCGPGGAEVVDDAGTYRIVFHAWEDPTTRKSRTAWTGPLSWGSGVPKVRTR